MDSNRTQRVYRCIKMQFNLFKLRSIMRVDIATTEWVLLWFNISGKQFIHFFFLYIISYSNVSYII